MINIYKPKIVKTNSGTRVTAVFEHNLNENILWYEIDDKYGEYLTDETADGFVVGLLFYALKHGSDMRILAPLSQNLYYSINNYLIPLLVKIHGYKQIKITCNLLRHDPIKNKGAVGTGLSCGVDSFATIIDHLNDDCPEGYKINYFTFFNVGSHGDNGGERARDLFKERAEITRKYAEEVNKEFITVDSNISEILMMNFEQTNTLRSLSAVLILQRLFNVYYYSSSVPITRFKLNKKNTNGYDIFNMSMLSTETIRFYSSCPMMTRVEKTKLVAKYEPSYKYLNVCFYEENNCGKCPKCLRTLLTLEVIGEIRRYSNVFNLEAYYSNRNNFIATIIAKKQSEDNLKEIHNEMLRQNFKIPLSSKIMSIGFKLKLNFKNKFMGKGRVIKLKSMFRTKSIRNEAS
ncbi:hypothetical protein ACLIBG_05195 [Virgibacillus sp. W0181]|uniref:hypothetical protein n=1 Tax=Virgibacillus sp. W0181 TaxID=3391581 RepID=UPI003F45EA17